MKNKTKQNANKPLKILLFSLQNPDDIWEQHAKNEFFALGEKINNKETLTDQEQKTYDDNKDIVDRVFNLVKKQKDKAGKKIDDKVDS